MTHEFELVDVFGTGPFSGNPLGVVHDAQGPDTETMHAITRWLNLSETCFLLPPTDTGADYRVRIFTLEREPPFAGHPTLGCAHAWLAAGGTPKQSGTWSRNARPAWSASVATPPASPSPRRRWSARVRSMRTRSPELAGVLNIDRGAIVEARWADNGPAGSACGRLLRRGARARAGASFASGSTSASSARIRPARRSPTRSGSSSATITAPCSKIR